MTRTGTEVHGRQKTGPNWTTARPLPSNVILGQLSARSFDLERQVLQIDV
jgi:hypothetical protein